MDHKYPVDLESSSIFKQVWHFTRVLIKKQPSRYFCLKITLLFLPIYIS